MDAFFASIYKTYPEIVVFIYAFSACIVVGGLFNARFNIKPIIFSIKIPGVKYEKAIKAFDICLRVFILMMILGFFAGYAIICGNDYENGNPATFVIVHTIEVLWLFMCADFIYAYLKHKEAKVFVANRDYIEAHENLELIYSYIIPLNLIISLIIVYFSVVLRG